jgi:hypothetical protein
LNTTRGNVKARGDILRASTFVIGRFRSRLRVSDMKTAIWIKRLGFWGFLFFLVKGLLWLLVPALAVYLAN